MPVQGISRLSSAVIAFSPFFTEIIIIIIIDWCVLLMRNEPDDNDDDSDGRAHGKPVAAATAAVAAALQGPQCAVRYCSHECIRHIFIHIS